MSKLTSFFKHNRFSIISWAVTFVLVAGMLLGTLRWKEANAMPAAFLPISTARPGKDPVQVSMPALANAEASTAIKRQIELKTNIPADKPRYDLEEYRVTRGDSIFAIAKSFKLKPETVLWANYDILQDTPG